MLKDLLNIEGIQKLDRKAQKETQGGQFLCETFCVDRMRRCLDANGNIIWVPC